MVFLFSCKFTTILRKRQILPLEKLPFTYRWRGIGESAGLICLHDSVLAATCVHVSSLVLSLATFFESPRNAHGYLVAHRMEAKFEHSLHVAVECPVVGDKGGAAEQVTAVQADSQVANPINSAEIDRGVAYGHRLAGERAGVRGPVKLELTFLQFKIGPEVEPKVVQLMLVVIADAFVMGKENSSLSGQHVGDNFRLNP